MKSTPVQMLRRNHSKKPAPLFPGRKIVWRGAFLVLLSGYTVVAVYVLERSWGAVASPHADDIHHQTQHPQLHRTAAVVPPLLPPQVKEGDAVQPVRTNGHGISDVAGDNDRDRVWEILRAAGVAEDTLTRRAAQLPAWSAIVEQYGAHPVLVGLESCAAYRASVPEEKRMLGAAGMFNTGTNLVTQLLKHNCYIPARLRLYGSSATKEQLGMRWQVPWGKHTPAHYKWQHATTKAAAIRKEDVLPVITVRNPWRWMQSMCHNPYGAAWAHHGKCPQLRTAADPEAAWNEVTVKYEAATERYRSLQHLWNDWYNAYLHPAAAVDATTATPPYPWIAVRMEDLVFHTVETVTAVCECAGGTLYTDRPFHYITDSAKADSPGHDSSTGIAEAWIKYGRPTAAGAGFDAAAYEAGLDAVDQKLMDQLHYHHPPPPLSPLSAAIAER